MAYTTINKSTDYFNTKLYTGNGSTQNITGVGFQPDWTWIKARAASGTGNDNHSVCDIVRTKGSYGYPSIYTNLTSAEYNPASGNEVITDFISDGFALGGNENSNYNSNTYVSWNWKANGAGSANTDGSINTTSTSVNTTAGFSISTYTGTGSTATFGHGLGAVPKIILIKRTNDTEHWQVYHQSLGNTKVIELSSTGTAFTDANRWNNTTPTNSLVYLGNHASVNASGSTYVAYCFAEKTGYSKFGFYTGNGASGTNPNVDGPFIYTGFKPKWILIKHSGGGSASGEHWNLQDVKRSPSNPSIVMLSPNQDSAQNSTNNNGIDFLSNGFKIKNNDGRLNNSSATYIYMAFGQSLVGSNNIPCTAR